MVCEMWGLLRLLRPAFFVDCGKRQARIQDDRITGSDQTFTVEIADINCLTPSKFRLPSDFRL